MKGERVAFTQIAATQMACLTSSGTEEPFHAALKHASRLRITGDRATAYRQRSSDGDRLGSSDDGHMIVRRIQGEIQFITQPAHARLAGRVMDYSVALGREPRRDAILQAIRRHDDGWQEEDEAPPIDLQSGEVLDFIHAPLAVRQGVWPRSVEKLEREPWAGALVAHHSVFVYSRYRADPAWRDYFARMEASRDALIDRTGLTLAALESDYEYLRLADLISLVFCTSGSERIEFAQWRIQPSGTSVMITPDPFGGVAVPIEIEARTVPDQRFASTDGVREALQRADVVTLHGIATAGSLTA